MPLSANFQYPAKCQANNYDVCRPEINVRDTAFRRGSTYLERYCMLIIFAAYLEAQRRGRLAKLTFQEWMAARPEILAARDAARQNPAGALAPLPTLQAPNLWLSPERHNSREVSPLPTSLVHSCHPLIKPVCTLMLRTTAQCSLAKRHSCCPGLALIQG